MKKLNWFARPEKFRNRLIMVILGVLIQGFGLSWLIEIHFGTDPCSAFTQGVISHVGLTFGTAQLLINLILLSSFPVRYKPDRFWNDCKYDLYRIYLRYLQMDLQQNLSRTFL